MASSFRVGGPGPQWSCIRMLQARAGAAYEGPVSDLVALGGIVVEPDPGRVGLGHEWGAVAIHDLRDGFSGLRGGIHRGALG